MGESTRHIWIDITDLSHWTGTLTGIQRTTFHIGREFRQLPNVRFFIATRGLDFVEAEFPMEEQFAPRPQENLSNPSATILKLKDLFRKGSKMLFERAVPSFLSGKVTHLFHEIGALSQDTRFALRGRKFANAIPRHPFQNGDVVILLGASWSWRGMMQALYKVRRSMDVVLVFTLYDLIPVKYPQFFGPGFGGFFGRYLGDVFSRSDIALSISESTTRDAKAFLSEMGIKALPIIQFRLGDNPREENEPITVIPQLDGKEYILSVGTIEIRKNYLTLYNAWVLAHDRGIDLPKLVIVGRPGWLVDDFLYQLKNDPRISNSIEIIQDVDDSSLAWLYRHCLFTIYPSWYEGWGLPIAESVQYGKFCITSSTSSMPEIAGDLLEYCEPSDSEGFLKKVTYYTHNRNALAVKQENLAKKYETVTWEESFHRLWQKLNDEINNVS